MNSSDKKINTKLNNLIQSLKDYGLSKESINLAIKNLYILKEAAIKPGGLVDGERVSYGYEEISKAIEENIIGSAKFEYFDCDMYVENIFGDIENADTIDFEEFENKYHAPVKEFVGNCFYKEAVESGLYDLMPDIIKDKCIIRKETLESRMSGSINILPEELRPKFNSIKESISTSENPFFFFLYDSLMGNVSISWKYVLHDTIHILKDYRIEDIIDQNKRTEEDNQIFVGRNHFFPDSFSYYQIFKRILEGPIKTNLYNFASFDSGRIAIRTGLLDRVLEEKNIPTVYGEEGFDPKKMGEEKSKVIQKIKSFESSFSREDLVNSILFIIIKNCLILSESGEKIDLLSEDDSTDRRTDLFSYHVFFGNITLSIEALSSEEVKVALSKEFEKHLLYLVPSLNTFYKQDTGSTANFISNSDIELYSKNIIDNFISSKAELIKRRIDLGFEEYSNFASQVESIFDNLDGNFKLKDEFSEYPNVSAEEYSEGLSGKKDLFLGSDKNNDGASYGEKIKFLQSLVRSKNVFKDRMIQLTKDEEGKFYDPKDYVYAFIRI